jgi:hypothetical protein
MQLGIMLRKHGSKAAAAGWDGDRYAVFEGPEGRLGLVWVSTWDSEDEAREFFKGYVAYQTSKVGHIGSPPSPLPDSVWRNRDNQLFVVRRSGRDVVVIEGFAPAQTPGLLDAALRAKQTELKPAVTKDAPKSGAVRQSALLR